MDFNEIYYSDGEISFGSKDGKTFLVRDKMFYLLTDYPWEPCLYVKSWDRKLKTLHHAFTVERLIELAKNGGTMELIRDTEFDVPQILGTILRAMELPLDDMDIDYAAAYLFIDKMMELRAVSEETAVEPEKIGLTRGSILRGFTHSKKVGETTDGRLYVREKGQKEAKADDKKLSVLLSDGIRFGYGYREYKGCRQYYAWHGIPVRNDDMITYAEISEEEYEQIRREYPQQRQADSSEAQRFRDRYVEGHAVLAEGMNVSLPKGE